MKTIDLEICAGSVMSAVNAKRGGATRIELCQNLNEGGTTPSKGLIDFCTNHLGLRTYVLVRPRGGGFVFTDEEHQLMLDDIRVCRGCGASGVVIGSLLPNGNINKKQTSELVEAAGGMEVTFHRAFDRCPDYKAALEDVIECGCTRILTSGCRPTAIAGSAILKDLALRAERRIKILAGSGITHENVGDILALGVDEVHGSCKIEKPQEVHNRHFTSAPYVETSDIEVRRLISAINAAGYTTL